MMRHTLLLSLILVAPASAQHPPALGMPTRTLDMIEDHLERNDDHLPSWLAPGFSAEDVYGGLVELSRFRGRVVVLSFITPETQDEALSWLKTSQIDYMGDPRVAFVNVVYPGPTNIMAGKRGRVRTLREQLDKLYAQIHDAMPPAGRERLKNTEIRWVADWKKDVMRQYDVTEDRVNLYFIDPRGVVREVIRHKSAQTEELLPRILNTLIQEVGS